ncbi:Protein CBG10238 [Caenorhabditis briggsae]|uniref:Protein CBG10238 n=1 Tax=Caenorhabditis briggsae TaxID=6238 RepID=A8XAS6_CAEBR|nr:Protein CBG10238 [Caenorhabditis briggsae]CAP29741.2 Protein CBG10238 [Caenorhabditis briggsae]
MKSLFMILLILAILPVSICLMCYGYNNYEEAVTTLHHRKFCTAVYSVHDGIGVFGGGERHPSRIPNIVELKDDHDCVFQTVESSFGFQQAIIGCAIASQTSVIFLSAIRSSKPGILH